MFEVLSIKMSVMVTVLLLCESRLNFDLVKEVNRAICFSGVQCEKKKNKDLTQRLSIISL